ncbi:MAG TPA: YraN family protein [Bacteroidales bacterium]|nr:YraN family protein [Bacteroidales bacterium]
MGESHDLGKSGEEIANEYLLKKGYTVLEKNWRHNKDEVDLIAQKDDMLVIVEVKTRSTFYFGEPEIFVNRKKQNFMIRAANAYILKNNIQLECRFDIISIVQSADRVSIRHIEDAFYPTL